MKSHAAILRSLTERIGVPHIKTLTTRPGVKMVHRITAYYGDGRARHSVATLYCANHEESHRMEVIYESFMQHKPMQYTVSAENYNRYVKALGHAHFDRLEDQRDPRLESMVLWLLERASGPFHKSLMISPHKPELPYSILVNAVDAYLPEAIREIAR